MPAGLTRRHPATDWEDLLGRDAQKRWPDKAGWLRYGLPSQFGGVTEQHRYGG
jgi:hypothetical protein